MKKFFEQFKNPRGFLGVMASKIMARSNRELNEWTISLLNLKSDDHVLEIGYGPGIGIEQVVRFVPDGFVCGLDLSEVSFKEAKKRNRKAIENHLLELRIGDVSELPAFSVKFDKIYSVNSIHFWNEPVRALRHLNHIMNPGGLLASTIQPREKGATDQTAKQMAAQIKKHMEEAGFENIEIKSKDMKPVSAVLGNRSLSD